MTARGFLTGRSVGIARPWLVLLLLFGAGRGIAQDDLAARVVIVANASDPASVALAEYYAQARAIPAANIVALPMSREETIAWPAYVQQIHEPLQQWLMAQGWMDAIAMDLRDDVGRRKVAVSGHRISFLVLCRGVPLKISESPEVPGDSPPRLPSPFRTRRAAVDSELAVLVQGETPRDGFVPNPLFGRETPSALELARALRVSRLDGPSDAAARQLLEGALAAERNGGLAGRAYVDVGGPHARGDTWFENVATQLEQLGFAPSVHRGKGTMAATDRADNAALYFGWYSSTFQGPFALPGYRFPVGAIALHLHSFSASSLRSETGGGWCGPLVARGVAATFGNVYEPYMEYTHQPQLLLRALARGAPLGEAAAYSIAALSWQGIVLGDPLYRPFGSSFEAQAERWRELPAPVAAAVVQRRAALGSQPPDRDEAVLALQREAMQVAPSLALALDLADRLQAMGETREAAQWLGVAHHLKRVPASEWALLREAAHRLHDRQGPAAALLAWQTLLAQPLPPEVRRVWLREARPVAAEARDVRLGQEWDRELAALAEPPNP